MAAPIVNNNSIEKTGFCLTSDGFYYYGEQYKYDDVIQTEYVKSIYQRSHVGIGVTSSSTSVGFTILMKTGQIVKIIEQISWKTDKCEPEKAESFFNIISQKTLRNRALIYDKQVKEQGCFEYSGWNFFPKDKKIVDTKRNETYFINETTFSREYGVVHVSRRNEGLGSKFLKKVVGGGRSISTIRDTDVFFALLKHYFNLAWS